MSVKDLTPDEQKVMTVFSGIVAKHSLRNFIAIIVAAFSAGTFMTKVKFDVNTAQSGVDSLRIETNERVKEWTSWRHSANGKIDETRWTVKNHEDRLTEAEKNLTTNTREIGDIKAKLPK